jgi:hypothetical protein
VIAWVVRFVMSALVLMAAVKIVTPQNPKNTFQRALMASLVINVLAVPLLWLWWFFLIPLLMYVAIWFGTLMGSYGIGPLQAIGVGLVGGTLAWLIDFLLDARMTL